MSGDPKKYRIQASRCTKWAAETDDPILKREFIDLAGQWTKMADDIEGLTDLKADTPLIERHRLFALASDERRPDPCSSAPLR